MNSSNLNIIDSCLNQAQLLGYVRKKLGEEEKIRVENHLLRCDLCYDAAEGIADLDIKEDAAYYIDNLRDDLKLRVNAGFISRRFKYYISAAAIILIACTAVLLSLKESAPVSLFREYFKPYPNIIPMVRGGESDFDLKAGMVLYNSGNYEQAVTEFNKILSTGIENEAARFYKGISFLALRKGDKAESDFMKVINIRDGKLRDQAEWYLALSYLQQNEPEKADKILTKIIFEKNYYSNTASVLKNRLISKND